ncbi:MAG: bifunctional 5,10-methylenetetrahydrofolate dehydrogenase/5,10-methenyltetrahydrofolate cyclohydrolase [bacterium]|nr:bifunctional 5,10-methylenetetrahydrofolate dehydrogenase/5,10-methenyltetrahydrofolate cyclohydrolase [bacterium]
MTIIFDGREFVRRKNEETRRRVEDLIKKGVKPTLVSIFSPSDAGSALYTKIKKDAAQALGIQFRAKEIEDAHDPDSIISEIEKINNDSKVHGILVQKPSGENDFSKEDWSRIISTLSPKKDVDGLTPENLGLIDLGTPRFFPATAAAVLAILEESKIVIRGSNVVIVGVSEILGKPLAAELTERRATVTTTHRGTRDLAGVIKRADILVSATGTPNLIKGDMVKSGVVVIDVGAPKGDVLFQEVKDIASFITPVPGGVGPVTVSCLLENTVLAAEEQ